MADVFGSEVYTLSDMSRRLSVGGDSFAQVLDLISKTNPIIDDITWLQGNLITGYKFVTRTENPKSSVRRINQGVRPSKSATRTIVETCMSLESRSKVDKKLIDLAPNPDFYRLDQDIAHTASLTDDVVQYLFTGDKAEDPETIDGFDIRYNKFGGKKGTTAYQVIDAGGKTENGNASIWVVSWGKNAVNGIYPRNTKAGIQMENLGQYTTVDANGGEYEVLGTKVAWDFGLAIEDYRKVAALRNIDVKELQQAGSVDRFEKFIKQLVFTKNRIHKPTETNTIMYVCSDIYDMLEVYLLDKNNVHVTRQEVENAGAMLFFSTIPIKKLDVLTSEEAAIKETETPEFDTLKLADGTIEKEDDVLLKKMQEELDDAKANNAKLQAELVKAKETKVAEDAKTTAKNTRTTKK